MCTSALSRAHPKLPPPSAIAKQEGSVHDSAEQEGTLKAAAAGERARGRRVVCTTALSRRAHPKMPPPSSDATAGAASAKHQSVKQQSVKQGGTPKDAAAVERRDGPCREGERRLLQVDAHRRRRLSEAQDAVFVHRLHEREALCGARRRARDHHRELLDERRPALGVQSAVEAPERRDGGGGSRRGVDDRVAAAVVRQPAALEHEGVAEALARLRELLL